MTLRGLARIDPELPAPAAALLWGIGMMWALSLAALLGLYVRPVLGGWALSLAGVAGLAAGLCAGLCGLCLRAWRREGAGLRDRGPGP